MVMMRPVLGQKRTPPETPEDKTLARQFEWRVRLSRLALFGERAWEALLWPFVVLSVFLIFSLLELWGLLPPLAHRILLGGFGLALLVSFLPLIRLSVPTRAEALRRLELNADIKHRPASSYEDKLGTTPRGDTALLWAAHRERLARLVAKLKPTWPTPADRPQRPLRAPRRAPARPDRDGARGRPRSVGPPQPRPSTLRPAAAAALLRLDAWVTPPVYTGMAPIVLADGSEPVGAGPETFRALSVPERSELIVRAYSPQGESVEPRSPAPTTAPSRKPSRRRRPAAKAWSNSTCR